jgi:hypothetical protein
MTDNFECLKVLLLCSNQIMIAQMTGKIIGLRLEAVESAMRIHNVKDKIKCAERVMWVFNKLHED